MRAFLAALGTIITLSVLPIVAQAEDVDQLIRTMDELSHQTNDKNEAVKHKEDEVKAAEDEVNRLTGVAQDTEAVARTAEESEKAFQAEVNRIAGAKYRGVAIDPMSKIFGAHNPQIAIDQTAYMATITAQTEEAVAKLVDATKVAKDARDAAAKAVEDAKQHKANLEGERDNLTREQEELKGKMKELMDKVNGLSPADRAKWVAKNGPIDYSIAGLVGANPIGMKALEIGMTKIGAPYGWAPPDPTCSTAPAWCSGPTHNRALPCPAPPRPKWPAAPPSAAKNCNPVTWSASIRVPPTSASMPATIRSCTPPTTASPCRW